MVTSFAFIAVGLVLIAFAVPLMRRKVKPNPFYGLRVPPTFADEHVWYDANAKSGRDMSVYAAGWVLYGLLSLGLPSLREERTYTFFAIAMAAGAIVMAVLGWMRASRMLRERQGLR